MRSALRRRLCFWSAFGAERKSTGSQTRLDPSKMTHNGLAERFAAGSVVVLTGIIGVLPPGRCMTKCCLSFNTRPSTRVGGSIPKFCELASSALGSELCGFNDLDRTQRSYNRRTKRAPIHSRRKREPRDSQWPDRELSNAAIRKPRAMDRL